MTVALMLIVWYWLQPTQNPITFSMSTINIMTALAAAFQTGKEVVATVLRRRWIKLKIYQALQVVFVFAAMLLCRERQPLSAKQNGRRRNLNSSIAKVSKSANWIMNKIGDYIQSATTPTRTTRRNRIWLATRNVRRQTTLLVMTVLAMQVNATVAAEREICFDTDSAAIGIDNRCSACISHCADNFEEGTLKQCDRVVKGFGGTRISNVQTGTLLWSWEDEYGIVTTFPIPNSYYVPDGKVRLLSPQHWAQTQAPNRKGRQNCYERTDGNNCILYWNSGESKRTVELGRRNNVATFSPAPGYDKARKPEFSNLSKSQLPSRSALSATMKGRRSNPTTPHRIRKPRGCRRLQRQTVLRRGSELH